jgi:uncharacterized protein YraI
MTSRATWPHGSVLRIVLVLGALALTVIQIPPAAHAQSCTNCVVAAGVDLNLLAEPRLEAEVLRVIPRGTLLRRDAGPETDRLAPVTYGGLSGWVIADGFFPVPDSIAAYAPTASTAPPATSTTTSTNARVTLAPLMLRSAPSMEAEPILVIPHGGVVTLTWEGAENGYVTVDYDGVRGWAYADLLGETVGTGQSGTRSETTVTNVGGAPVAGEPAPVTAAPAPVAGECDPSYPGLCISPGSANLDCAFVYGLGMSHITVLPPDPLGFDGDGDGVGCEG